MPIVRFLALNSAIRALRAEETIAILDTTFHAFHPGERGKSIKDYRNRLMGMLSGKPLYEKPSITPGITIGTKALEVSSETKQEREEKIAKFRKRQR